MISKNDARKTVKEKRKEYPEYLYKSESLKLSNLILDMDEFKDSETVFLYASVKGEVDTYYIMKEILKLGKKLALPVTVNKEMTFYLVESLEELKPGYMSIPEPKTLQAVLPDEKTLMIMPGVAFDKKCHRAGYGAGCYDRYLRDKGHFTKIAPAFDFQLFEEIESHEFDICPDVVILPDGREFCL